MNTYFLRLIVSIILLSIAGKVSSQSGRIETDLSDLPWHLWLDTKATWQDDSLFLPGTNVNQLPENTPTGGWPSLNNEDSKTVHLPATVEQYFWGLNGNSFGVSGNYLGVSWFHTHIFIPESMKHKRVLLDFESVRFRAEVFINQQMAGYDLIHSTPFQVDITPYIHVGSENHIAVRITDPNGNFDWRDSKNFMWGKYRTQPTHGFGGITGKVKLIATDPVFISDLYVQNQPETNAIKAFVTIENATSNACQGSLLFEVREHQTNRLVWQKEIEDIRVIQGKTTKEAWIQIKQAALWSPDHPFLYSMRVVWKDRQNNSDITIKRFGFRWFEIRTIDGDKQFFLNGKRIVLRTAISWGFWPINGIAPSDSLARKQIKDAKRLGLNMLNFHRTIGQTNVLDYADELGLLYFEEPGGNQYPVELFEPANEQEIVQTRFYLEARDEKLRRMILRDRSHPSLVIYNLHNERGAQPHRIDREQMQLGHRLDPSRIMTYNSSNGSIKTNEPDARFKLHLLPFDTTFYDYGWFDQHHAGGPGTYHDNLYTNPHQYLRYTNHQDEIVYYGEEGAIGTPPRLQLIKDEIDRHGKDQGWETSSYLKWFDAYDSFLHQKGFINAFPNVDTLTRKMGNVAYYYQGRIIENIRINNITDGYAVNGWESMKLENHSGIVDNYRNFKGDPDLISKYNQPLYLAVKLNHKVLKTGSNSVIDVFIVNEKEIHGTFTLQIEVITPDGKKHLVKSEKVKVSGGSKYGELLISGVPVTISHPGYTHISAQLLSNNRIITKGDDCVFAVDLPSIQSLEGQIADTAGIIGSYLKSTGTVVSEPYTTGAPKGKVLLIGAFDPPKTGNPLVTDILEWVNNGNTLLVIGTQDKWAEYLAKKEVADYRGSRTLGTTWYGGNFFVREHPVMCGLPMNCVFNWEYQCLAGYNKNRSGMRLNNGETIVACVSDHQPEVYTALGIIPHGRGRVIICTLDLTSCIREFKAKEMAEGDGENAAMKTFDQSATNRANVVGQRILLNLINHAQTTK